MEIYGAVSTLTQKMSRSQAKDNHLCITKSGITEGDDLDWLQIEHPPLKRLDNLFNEGFYLYDHANDILLTAYNSGRVPRLIGPFETNVVDLYAYQEQEKALAERNGETFTEFTITRSANLSRMSCLISYRQVVPNMTH